MKLKGVHSVLEFEQECWMEQVIRMNTEFRKNAKNKFEIDFYKLMNKSVFCKTMENLSNSVDIEIVCRNERQNKEIFYSRHVLYSNDVGIDMRKSRFLLNWSTRLYISA